MGVPKIQDPSPVGMGGGDGTGSVGGAAPLAELWIRGCARAGYGIHRPPDGPVLASEAAVEKTNHSPWLTVLEDGA